MNRFHSLVFGGILGSFLVLTSCGATLTGYEDRLGSEKKVVAERYLPSSVDLLFSLDTRDTDSLSYAFSTLHRYFPEYISEEQTLETFVERYAPMIKEELELSDDMYTDLRAIVPLANRLVIAMDLLVAEDGTTLDPDVYGAFIVQDMQRLQVLYEKFMALPEVSERTHRGATYMAVEGLTDYDFYGFLQDDMMFITSTERAMQRVLDVRDGKEATFLSQQLVKDAETRIQKPILLSGYMDYESFTSSDMWMASATSEEERKMAERMKEKLPMPGLMWGQLFVSERGIEIQALTNYDATEYEEKLGISFSELVRSGPALGEKVEEGAVLYGQEYSRLVSIASPVFAVMHDSILETLGEDAAIVRSQMTYFTNLIQYHTGLSWKEDILPFLDLPSFVGFVDEGEIFPRFVQLTDVQDNPELGDRIVTQISLSVDNLINFLDLQFAETHFPLPSSLYVKEEITGGVRMRYSLAPYYQGELSGIAEYLSGSALAMLRSLELTMDATHTDGVVHLSFGVSSSFPTLARDEVFHGFMTTLTSKQRTQFVYLGVTAFANYAERLYSYLEDFGILEIAYASLTAEERAEQEAMFADNSEIFFTVLAELRRFTSLETVSLLHEDRLAESYMILPFAK